MEVVRALRPHGADSVLCCAFDSTNSRIIFTGAEDGALALSDLRASGRALRLALASSPGDAVAGLSQDPWASEVLWAAAGESLVAVDLRRARSAAEGVARGGAADEAAPVLLRRVLGENEVNAVACDPAGPWVACADDSGSVTLYDRGEARGGGGEGAARAGARRGGGGGRGANAPAAPAARAPKAIPSAHANIATCLVWPLARNQRKTGARPERAALFSGGADCVVVAWDVATCTPARRWSADAGPAATDARLVGTAEAGGAAAAAAATVGPEAEGPAAGAAPGLGASISGANPPFVLCMAAARSGAAVAAGLGDGSAVLLDATFRVGGLVARGGGALGVGAGRARGRAGQGTAGEVPGPPPPRMLARVHGHGSGVNAVALVPRLSDGVGEPPLLVTAGNDGRLVAWDAGRSHAGVPVAALAALSGRGKANAACSCAGGEDVAFAVTTVSGRVDLYGLR